MNYSDIAKNVGVDKNTITSWIFILETSGIIYLLQPYSEYKLSKRIVKSPKLYFIDIGLAAHLAKVYDSQTLMISNLAGAFMETYVMNEILKSYRNNKAIFNGYYYRDSNRNEIDLVIQENQKIHCIEIKKGSMFNESHVKAFKQLVNSQYEMGISCVICNTMENYAINSNVLVCSVSCI